MVICDPHRFVFLHIPKCAGTTVRAQIRRFDSYDGHFERAKDHPTLGRVDFGHIPLRMLAEAFPAEFEKVLAYESFAVIRDPVTRFGSSIRQTLHFFERVYPAEMSRTELREAVLRLIDRLESTADWAGHELTFFQPQVDFVEHEGRRVTRRLYPVERIDDMLDEIGRRVGTPMRHDDQRNRDLAFKSRAFVRPAYAVNAFLWRHAPERLHASLKRIAVPMLTRGASASKQLGIDEMPEVRAFVARHYSEDAELHSELVTPRIETPREQPRAH